MGKRLQLSDTRSSANFRRSGAASATSTTRRETLSNTRAYRDLLEGRLSRIVEQQQALCRNCLGTGREPDPNILLIYCPVCLRVDPVHAPNVRYFNNL